MRKRIIALLTAAVACIAVLPVFAQEDMTYECSFNDFSVEGDTVKMQCYLTVRSHLDEAASFYVMAESQEDVETGLLKEKELTAKDAEGSPMLFTVEAGGSIEQKEITLEGAFGGNPQKADREAPDNIHLLRVYPFHPTRDNVEAFAFAKDQAGVPYNVTPVGFAERYGFEIFKWSETGSSILRYEGKIYPLGEFFGGFGVTSFAVADQNADGREELYFTFSWGSGLPRSCVGYFDTADKTVKEFEWQNFLEEALLCVDENQQIAVYSAAGEFGSVNDETYGVDIVLFPQKKRAQIDFDGEKITLSPVEE